MLDRPFHELHELYRIVFLRHEAQMKAEEERKKKEAEEEAANRNKNYRPPSGLKPNKYITNQTTSTNKPEKIDPGLSLLDMDSMEDALEELVEGGGF